jgi:hypothetical protein
LHAQRPCGRMPAVSAAEEIEPGHYLGTEIEGKWWKRYRALTKMIGVLDPKADRMRRPMQPGNPSWCSL